jgi:hypothetical protein
MIFQPPPSIPVYDPFKVGNFRWTEPFLWIGIITAAAFALFLLIDYVKTNKKAHLLWCISLAGLSAIFYECMTMTQGSRGGIDYQGNWRIIIWLNFESIEMVFVSTLMLIIPGLIATGLVYETMEDKKLGDYFLYFTLVMDVIVMILIMVASNGLIKEAPSPGLAPNSDSIDTFPVAFIAQLILQVPALLAIIILPIMKNKEQKAGYLLALAGILMLVMTILLVTVGFGTLDDKTFMDVAFAEGDLVDIVLGLYPFIMLGAVLCLVFGMLMPEKWGFSIPGIEFEER